jgi:hypothetical protein
METEHEQRDGGKQGLWSNEEDDRRLAAARNRRRLPHTSASRPAMGIVMT